MTSPEHSSGTDRLVEVMAGMDVDIYINLQGDEPLVRQADLGALIAGMLADSNVKLGHLNATDRSARRGSKKRGPMLTQISFMQTIHYR
ncbi:cytidylyltransferase domain-containing protein [Pseudomonas atacamensis]|uniref:cytidylyltransferase domain-containing protein n=1 Tax=Pseudomonas atacamensis TaxID=2565368 RepID=UPI0021F0DC98|nr:hypothetical protein [Pseudomonas atacamensis]